MRATVAEVVALGMQWPTLDPFLFCVHHDDAYPAGNDDMGPAASLGGRNLGSDFDGIDGWRMYHGTVVPGFPQHPHRGFETVTYVRRGLIDHSDSLGATARFGRGDVQWLTAGRGIVHAEMFPLVDRTGPNPAELFQIWLNLPRADKLVDPYFTMLWDGDIPHHDIVDDHGRRVRLTTIAGAYDGHEPPPPPPHSWASRGDAELAIWHLVLDAGATFTLPGTSADVNRALYVFGDSGVTVDDQTVPASHMAVFTPGPSVLVTAGGTGTECLLLQGRAIGEPVAQYGPFVMTTRAEVAQALDDYQRDQFGGWPFGDDGPVHPRAQARFARHGDGRIETAPVGDGEVPPI